MFQLLFTSLAIGIAEDVPPPPPQEKEEYQNNTSRIPYSLIMYRFRISLYVKDKMGFETSLYAVHFASTGTIVL